MDLIIGGTSESREFIENINGNDYVVSVATDSGTEFLETKNVHIGRMNYEQMLEFSKEKRISRIFDLSHPFALIVTDNVKKVAKELGIEYYRYIRPYTEDIDMGIKVFSVEECMEEVSKLNGNFLFTTGSKNIHDFETVRRDNRFIYRVLPALESIQICNANNVKLEDIIAVLGPFSKAFNKVLFEDYKIDYCVMKDSGGSSGTTEKIEACKENNVIPIVIARRDEDGIDSMEELIKIQKEGILNGKIL
ncbi:MAG: precorrin-6A reductase [Tissierellia bacterium]|nr:precorrin-6A reductase [Tissierellia bacterium]